MKVEAEAGPAKRVACPTVIIIKMAASATTARPMLRSGGVGLGGRVAVTGPSLSGGGDRPVASQGRGGWRLRKEVGLAAFGDPHRAAVGRPARPVPAAATAVQTFSEGNPRTARRAAAGAAGQPSGSEGVSPRLAATTGGGKLAAEEERRWGNRLKMLAGGLS